MPFRLHSLAATPAFFAALSLLLGTTATGACAATPQNKEALSGNWVTTGSNVATTFTQVTPSVGVSLFPSANGGGDTNEEITAQTSPHLLRLSPQSLDTIIASDGVPFNTQDSGDGTYVSSTLGEPSLSRGDGGAAAVVPEPGPMVTVVVLGFMTGVALLRGQSRVSAARLIVNG